MKMPVKKVIKRVLLAFGLIIFCTVIYILVTTPLEGGIYGYRTAWTDDPGYLRGVLLFAAIVAVPLLLIVFFPVVTFLCRRLGTYVSLAFVSLRYKCRFRALRGPFASLKQMSPDGDISITTEEGTLHIHFVDIVFAHRRVVTFPDDGTYVVTPIIKGTPVKQGVTMRVSRPTSGRVVGRTNVFRSGGYTLQENQDVIKFLPDVIQENGIQHILVVQSTPLELRIVRDCVAMPVSIGQPVGLFRIYSLKQLKKGLKGELYTSFFDIDLK